MSEFPILDKPEGEVPKPADVVSEKKPETMTVTRETQVDDEIAERFWEIYDEAFKPLRTMSPCRQYLKKEEFLEEMQDSRVLKFILWDDQEKALAMSLVAQDLEAVPWISPDYFEEKFPQQFAAGNIYYFGALLVEPGSQGLHFSEILLEELENFVVRNKGIAAFDVMQINNEFLPKLIKETTEKQAEVDCIKLDTQHYYAYVAGDFKQGVGPSEYADN